jgi:AcrR family transcriptional regulator
MGGGGADRRARVLYSVQFAGERGRVVHGHRTVKAGRGAVDREVILAVARELLVADGIDGVSFRRIASRLGVTAPALYGYVDGKADLLRALAEQEFSQLLARFAAVDDPDPLARIRGHSRAYVAYAREHPALFEVMFVFRPAWVRADAEELPLATEVFGAGLTAIEEAVAAGQLHGDSFMVALTMWSAVHGVASVLLANPGLGAPFEDALVEQVIDTVLAGLAVPPST